MTSDNKTALGIVLGAIVLAHVAAYFIYGHMGKSPSKSTTRQLKHR